VISIENCKIFPPLRCVFCAHADGVFLGIGYRRSESKNKNVGATRWTRRF